DREVGAEAEHDDAPDRQEDLLPRPLGLLALGAAPNERLRDVESIALLCQVIPLGYRVTGSWQYGQRKRMTFKIAVSTSWRLISGRLGLGGGAARFSRRALFPRV